MGESYSCIGRELKTPRGYMGFLIWGTKHGTEFDNYVLMIYIKVTGLINFNT